MPIINKVIKAITARLDRLNSGQLRAEWESMGATLRDDIGMTPGRAATLNFG